MINMATAMKDKPSSLSTRALAKGEDEASASSTAFFINKRRRDKSFLNLRFRFTKA